MSKKRSGCMIDGVFVSFYDQGYNAYISHQAYRSTAGAAWCAGWRAGRDNDFKLWRSSEYQVRRDKISARICKALGISEAELLAA